MRSASREARALAALALMTWTQACYSYRAPPSPGALPAGGTVRATAATPFAVRGATGVPGEEGVVLCHTTKVEGTLSSVSGDTVLIAPVVAIVSAPGPDGVNRACPSRPKVSLVRSSDMSLEISRLDGDRTASALVVIAVVIIGFVASAAGWIGPGSPSGGIGFGRPAGPP